MIKDMLVIYFSYELLKMRNDEKNKTSTHEGIVKMHARVAKILSDYINKKLATDVAASVSVFRFSRPA